MECAWGGGHWATRKFGTGTEHGNGTGWIWAGKSGFGQGWGVTAELELADQHRDNRETTSMKVVKIIIISD